MALTASALSFSGFQIKLSKCQPHQLRSHLLIHAHKRPISALCSEKLSITAQLHEPPRVKLHMNYVREKFWEVIPDSAKKIPWKKTGTLVMQQFLVLGQEALKCSLIALFIFSSMSDIVYSISRNRELIIPLGLFVGCIMTDFLKETIQELFRQSEERSLNWQLLSIGCFFVLVKIISTFFMVEGWEFLLHATNGGLMQVWWLSRSLSEEQDRDNKENSLPEDASNATNAED